MMSRQSFWQQCRKRPVPVEFLRGDSINAAWDSAKRVAAWKPSTAPATGYGSSVPARAVRADIASAACAGR
jgi:hypothetical protein